MVIPRSLTFLTAFHGGWDFGCCRIGLAASAMDFESGLPPGCKGKASCIGKPKSPSPPGAWRTPLPRAARIQPRGCKGRSPLHKKTKNLPLPRWAPAPQVQPVPSGFSPGDARGEAPCIRKLKISPFPAGEGGRGDGGKNKAKGRGSRRPNRQAASRTPPSLARKEWSYIWSIPPSEKSSK